MRLINRWARVATAAAAGALVLGVGTVAAQSTGDPWWHEIFQAGPDNGQSEQGEVAIVRNPALGFDLMSGSLGRAKQAFPETEEYIGCQVFTDPNDGQFLTCAARDAFGSTLECTTLYEPGEFQLRQHMMLNAALNLTDTHYVAIAVNRNSGECASLQVMAASADFLAPREPLSECTEQNSVDLGPFGGSPVIVPNNACVKVTRFAKPSWKYGPNRTMQLQNPAGNAYPVEFDYKQVCTNQKGSGRFDHNFDDQYLPGLSDTCTLFIKLKGRGNGIISLRYW
ncbi:MAG TPA: hypothetical protein VI197_11415 [Polyangiaceae bacterium]